MLEAGEKRDSSAKNSPRIGTEQVLDNGQQAHFHGFGIADTFASLSILPELQVGLNLLAFNPSASDGYRVSAAVKPGIAAFPSPCCRTFTWRIATTTGRATTATLS